ncbi:TetR/AcrR family transcriptional regulator [Actinoallomurus sp. NPDC052274]|uniref:TetR/AcrR family transcriptional regulator n=1 Tax=Actinoallomurus sp. NPDC052274 TaxID=3155420 RepID=UPI0034187286
MSPRRRDAESTAAARAERRAELLATAAEVFASRGYAATTVREVAEAADMLGGSLYYHFDSKESMVDEILTALLTELWTAYDKVIGSALGTRETFQALITESFRMIDRFRPAVVIYQNESKLLASNPRFSYLHGSRRRFREMWMSVLEQGVTDGVFRADLDLGLLYRLTRDNVWLVANWYRGDGRLSAEEIAGQYTAMVLEGILRT